MEPSEQNKTNEEATSGANAAPVSTQEPAAVGTNASVGTNPVSEPTESGSKTGLWIGLGVGALVLIVAGVAAALLIPQMLQPDYDKMADVASDLFDGLSDYFYSSACHDVRFNVDDYYSTSVSEYSGMIEDCKKDAIKVYDDVAKFESESGVSRDSEINDLYIKFKKAFSKKAPSKDQLDSTLKTYEALHNFVVQANELDNKADSMVTPSEFARVTNNLTDSGNGVLKSFGEGLNQRYGVLYDAAQAYSKARYSDSNYSDVSDDYWDARDDFLDYFNEQSEILDELEVSLADTSGDGDDSVVDTFNDMQSAIIKKLR